MVAGDQVDELVAGIHASAGDVQEQQAFRPMRSPYWLIPFVACLAGEWWLRRRTGLS
jgi:paraquat-inducible protein B